MLRFSKKLISLIMMLCIIFLSLPSCNSSDTPPILQLKNNRYLTKAAPMDDGVIIADSISDGNYNYFVLDVGYIENVPLVSGTAFKYDGKTPLTVSLEKSQINESAIEKSASTTVSKAIETHNLGSASFGASLKIGGEMSPVSAEFSATYSRSWGNITENANSTTNTMTTAEAFSDTLSEAITITVGENDEPVGMYRISMFAVCDIYAQVKTTRDNSKLISVSFAVLARPNPYIALDYTQENFDSDSIKDKITLPDNFHLSLPIPEIGNTDNSTENENQFSPISVTMNRYNCKDGSKYDKNNPTTNTGAKSRHDGYEIGKLNLYGCHKTSSGYRVLDTNNFAIRYHVLQNTEDLPNINAAKKSYISNDSETHANETNIDSRIGYGAYWVRITYTDDSQVQYNKTDILKYATNGTVIDIVTPDNIDTNKSIKKIDIVIIYEHFAGAPGFLDIWWKDYTNWRCEYTFNFDTP